MTFAPIAMKIDLAEALTEELEIEEIFHIDIGPLRLGFDESTVVSWIIMAVMTLLAIILTRGFKVQGKISKRQALLEMCYEKAEGFFKGLMSEKVFHLIPWLMSTALFIGASNTIGLFGFKPPTKSMQVAAAMALTSIVLIEYISFKSKGLLGRLKAFSKPIAIVTPINILEVFTKPLSLCMRLFGNVLAAFTIMEIVKIYVPVVVPMVLSLYFDIFDGLLQTYIFVFLTALYLHEAVVEEEEKPKTKEQKKLEKQAKKEEKLARKAEKKAKKAA